MKKIIKMLTVILFSTSLSGLVIACVNPFIAENIFRITIVTDGHTITDHSFNESAYNGVLKFKSEFEKWVSQSDSTAPNYLRKKKIVVTTIQPATTDLNAFLQSYGLSTIMDSKVTIAPGFIQNSALVAAQNGILKHKMRYISIDSDTTNDVVSYKNKNLAGLLYQAEQSGLMAAIAAGSWLIAEATKKNSKYDVSNLKMSSFGGLNIPAVTSYMYGFYWGIELLNGSEKYSLEFNKEIKSWIKVLNPDFDDTKQLPKITFVNLANQFTGSFDQASVSSKALNATLINENTNVIFPVAGPQVADTLSAFKVKNNNGKVVGVDTDQQLQYTESASYFLTSALKNIVDSINYMLWRAINYDETKEHNQLKEGEQDKIFKENAPNRGGKEFIGIANNKAISSIYENIINSSELNKDKGFLFKISQGWNKVFNESKGDFWVFGKEVNPFILS